MKAFKIIIPKWIFMGIPLIGTLACTKDFNDSIPSSSANLRPVSFRTSSDFLHISYTLELTTLVKAASVLTNSLDQIVATPMLSRQNVDFKMDALGNYQVEVTQLPDSRSSLFTFESPPSDVPLVVKSILTGNQLTLFDENGSLVQEETVDPIPITHIGSLLEDGIEGIDQQRIDQILGCLTQRMPMDTILAYIENPPAGAVVQSFLNGMVSIRIPVPMDSAAQVAYSSVHLIDIPNKRLLGTRLYDNIDQVLLCRMYNYDECQLTAFTEESVEILPSGDNVIVRTIGRLEGLTISIVKQ